jgi:hypothetical protein
VRKLGDFFPDEIFNSQIKNYLKDQCNVEKKEITTVDFNPNPVLYFSVDAKYIEWFDNYIQD